mgnify:CR=1 FL=1
MCRRVRRENASILQDSSVHSTGMRSIKTMELQQDIVFDQAEDRIGEELLVMIEGKVADENAMWEEPTGMRRM